METQIIILFLLGIFYVITISKLLMTSDDSKLVDALSYYGLNIITTALIFITALIMIIKLNGAQKQLKGKCPEYQMIDSVYILKR